ncbi:hypothetical protein CHK_1334 [Christensenella hongkongensis]|uniref:Uncharacterized protein n=1 Tax=Christensenella hongkongensis TaxID=270498 RepID=A0A0M2NKH0_9FIRM|nr:hypothetical protein CHK_1334 [Christensenella hongkongensis]
MIMITLSPFRVIGTHMADFSATAQEGPLLHARHALRFTYLL